MMFICQRWMPSITDAVKRDRRIMMVQVMVSLVCVCVCMILLGVVWRGVKTREWNNKCI